MHEMPVLANTIAAALLNMPVGTQAPCFCCVPAAAKLTHILCNRI